MRSRFLHPLINLILSIGVLTWAFLSIMPVTAQAQAVADLTILNPPNGAGNIVISKGTSVEVEFNIQGDSSQNDELQLIRVDDNSVVSKKKRGNSTSGTVNLDTNSQNAIGNLRVDYVHAGAVVASAANQVVVVADEGSVVLSEQIADLEAADDVLNAQIALNTAAIGANAANITSNTGSIAANAATIGANTAAIAGNTANITANAGNIASNTANIGGLDARLTAAEADLLALNAINLGTLPADVAQNTSDINLLTGLVQANLTDIETLQNGVGTLQTDVGILQTDIGNLQNGETGFIPIWNAPDTLGNSNIFQNGTGNVGIGTTTPGATLQVGDGTTNSHLQVRTNDIGLTVTSVNPTSPASLGQTYYSTLLKDVLNVGDAQQFRYIFFANNNGGPSDIRFYSTIQAFVEDPNNTTRKSGLRFLITRTGDTQDSMKMTITGDGNVGIGTGSPTSTLHVIGTVFATGGVSSSRTLKDNITRLSIQEAKEALKGLDPMKFNYKDDASKDLQIGFIAEDVPELVSTPERKGIQPMDIIAILTKVTQDQQRQIEFQQNKIEELAAQITQQNEILKARLSRLEAKSNAIPVGLH